MSFYKSLLISIITNNHLKSSIYEHHEYSICSVVSVSKTNNYTPILIFLIHATLEDTQYRLSVKKAKFYLSRPVDSLYPPKLKHVGPNQFETIIPKVDDFDPNDYQQVPSVELPIKEEEHITYFSSTFKINNLDDISLEDKYGILWFPKIELYAIIDGENMSYLKVSRICFCSQYNATQYFIEHNEDITLVLSTLERNITKNIFEKLILFNKNKQESIKLILIGLFILISVLLCVVFTLVVTVWRKSKKYS